MQQLSYSLEVYEGPLDLLLNLIAKNKVNIYDIPISLILEQYMEQIRGMKVLDLEVTADFLAMASQLLLIKSRMLLPTYNDEKEDDPREQLVRLLLEYRRYKEVVSNFFIKSNTYSNIFVRATEELELDNTYSSSHSLEELHIAYRQTIKRIKRRLPPPVNSFSDIVGKVIVSVNSKVIFILRKLLTKGTVNFYSLFDNAKSRSDIVATFLAVLELTKSKKLNVSENSAGEIKIKIKKQVTSNK